MSSNGKDSPPLFGDDADSDRDNEDMFSSTVEKPENNNEKSAILREESKDSKRPDEKKAAEPEAIKDGGESKPEASTTAAPSSHKVDKDPLASPPESEDIFGTNIPIHEENDDIFASVPVKQEKHQEEKPKLKTKPSSDEVVSSSSKPAAPFSPTSEVLPSESGARSKVMTSSDLKPEGRGLVSSRLNSERLHSYDLEDDSTTIEILVSDPKKIGDGMNSYIVYKVTTRTNSKMFRSCEFTVTRRFSDFLGLHEKLQESYQPKGKVVPLPPEKNVMGTTKVKMTKEESAAQDFVEKRRASLERFLNRVAKHPDLRNDTHFIEFLENDGDLPKATNTSALSGAGIARLFNKFGDSLNKITFTMNEPDQWFEDKIEEIETLDRHLKDIYASVELLVIDRKELALSTGQMARSLANLGSQEEELSLSKALSSLAEVELKIEQLQTDQSDSDFYVFCELIKDYINLIQSIKEVLHERVKLYKVWQESESALTKKREQKAKMEQQRKFDRQIDQDIADCEERVSKFKDNFEVISASIRREIGRFERQRTRDFKTTLINYLQCMMNNQQQIAAAWESYLPEAKLISSPST